MTNERAVLAGGCFWGMEDLIRRLPGVVDTRVGYTGGEVPNATYRNHGNHAEAIEITFDPAKTSFRTLLEFFFQIHDPTTINRQGNDRGASYRSAIFYTNDEQKKVAEDGQLKTCHNGVQLLRQLVLGGRHRIFAVARQCRDGSHAGQRFLGGRTGASGLPGAYSERLHLPLHPPRLEAAAQDAGGLRAVCDTMTIRNAGSLPAFLRFGETCRNFAQ